MRWFYGQEGHRLGPYTDVELRDLAISGKILHSDTVWKLGIERGILATKVKHLFPPTVMPRPIMDIVPVVHAPPPVSEPALAPVPKVEPTPEKALEQPIEAVAAIPAKPAVAKKQVRQARAVAVRGARINTQDGVTVRFTKICVKCGYEDPSRTTMPIRTGTSRLTFYCRKCRKAHEVEIQGMT